MTLEELPPDEQQNLNRITAALLALKARLVGAGFVVVEFSALVSADMIGWHTIEHIDHIPVTVTVDGTLPAGTVKVWAKVGGL